MLRNYGQLYGVLPDTGIIVITAGYLFSRREKSVLRIKNKVYHDRKNHIAACYYPGI